MSHSIGRLRPLGEIVFIGLGLNDEKGISLRGLQEVKAADSVFIELYTSLMPNFSVKGFEAISGKPLHLLSRKELEEENGETLLETARKGKVALLVPGDPLIATTHIALRLQAEKLRIKTSIVHGASVLSAVMSVSGLHNYKFGKSVTIPFSDGILSETPYNVIEQNKKLGLHTLCLLDIRAEEKRYLSIHESLFTLLKIEEKRKKKIVTMNTLAIGIARVESENQIVKADFIRKLLSYDFGEPPFSIIFPSELHFMEAEALIFLARAPKSVRKYVK
jgi:diphthine synthase